MYFSFYFLTASSDEPLLGKKETAREWKLVMFPFDEKFYNQVMNAPDCEENMIPFSAILSRWQLPIQVLSETRDPKNLKKGKRSHTGHTDDWPEPLCKKPKASVKKQNFIELLTRSEVNDNKIDQMEEILSN